MFPFTTCLFGFFLILFPIALTSSPIIVKNVTVIGPQLAPDVTAVSRDGGYSVLVNGNIVWLYDDTECTDLDGNQLSFISNTAAYQHDSNNLSTVTDFGVVHLGVNKDGSPKTAILAGTTVGTGGWIPFQPDELEFNQQNVGKERVAIWPGSSPTPVSTESAFLYAPLVYVDYKPQDPAKEYQARGMTLVAIRALDSGPLAIRQGDLIIPGTEVPFGGFAALMGYKSTDSSTDKDKGNRDVYLLGVTNAGLQLARVGLNDLNDFTKYTFWDPHAQKFSEDPPKLTITDPALIYMSGSFTSGGIFYSLYFGTFVMIYFNGMVDSTFYIRYLQLDKPSGEDQTWSGGGKNGEGIVAEDVEALVKYQWSTEQKLYESPPGKGGFNYAGNAHPEYFNSQYFPRSLYPSGTKTSLQRNAWYGSSLISQKDAGGDGKNLLLSWTSQVTGGTDNGIYQIELAVLTFDDIPSASRPVSSTNSGVSATSQPSVHIPVSSVLAAVGKAAAARGSEVNWVLLLWSFWAALPIAWFGICTDKHLS